MVQKGISIVIPTKNRLNDLRRCLESLIPQLSSEDEIIVIDNGSSDGTSDYLRLLSENLKNIKYIHDPTPNLSHLFNLGWRNAKNELIGFLNDDTEPSKYWVNDVKKWFRTLDDASVIGGPTQDMNKRLFLRLNGKIFDTLKKFYFNIMGCDSYINYLLTGNKEYLNTEIFREHTGASCYIDYFEPQNPIQVGGVTITNMAVRKEILEKLNGFKTIFKFAHMDGYFFYECNINDYKIYLVPGAKVKHYVNPSGSTRSIYYLSADYAVYLKMLKPKKIKNKLRLNINKIGYFIFLIYAYKFKGIKMGLKGYRDGLRRLRNGNGE